MEDYAIKAIFIGVSVFVTILTLSAVILYFNTARSVADVVNERTDIAMLFDEIMNSDNFETTLTGVQVRSLINKYAGNEKVHINIINIKGTAVNFENVNNAWLNEINVVSEQKLDLIDPAWTNRVEKVKNEGTTTLNLYLNV